MSQSSRRGSCRPRPVSNRRVRDVIDGLQSDSRRHARPRGRDGHVGGGSIGGAHSPIGGGGLPATSTAEDVRSEPSTVHIGWRSSGPYLRIASGSTDPARSTLCTTVAAVRLDSQVGNAKAPPTTRDCATVGATGMAQGGRGWFHRKRHQPEPEQPTTGTTHASSLAAQQAQPNPSTPPAAAPSVGAADQHPVEPRSTELTPASADVGREPSVRRRPVNHPRGRLLPPTHRRPAPRGGQAAARKPTATGSHGPPPLNRPPRSRTQRSRLPGARDGGLRRRARNFDLPGTRAGHTDRSRVSDGCTDAVRHGAPRTRPTTSRLPSSRRRMDDTLGEPGAGAHPGTRRRRCTDATADDRPGRRRAVQTRPPPRPRREAMTGMPPPRRR